MTALPTIPLAEALVGDWLREHPDVVALDANVASKTPRSTVKPWVRVTQLDAADSPRGQHEHLIEYLLQLDCYAGKQATDDHIGPMQAASLAGAVRAVLKAQQGQQRDGVVVTSVRFVGHARLPDEAMEPARERVVLTVAVMMHALPA